MLIYILALSSLLQWAYILWLHNCLGAIGGAIREMDSLTVQIKEGVVNMGKGIEIIKERLK